MVYYIDVTTENTYTASSPKSTVLKITRGLIYRVEVEFPPGPLGNLGVAIFDGNYQAWPSSPGYWWHTDWRVIAFDDLYFKSAAPFELIVKTYNTGDSYSHWCGVHVALVSKEEFIARFLPGYTGPEAEKKLAAAQAQQEAAKAEILRRPFPWIRR